MRLSARPSITDISHRGRSRRSCLAGDVPDDLGQGPVVAGRIEDEMIGDGGQGPDRGSSTQNGRPR